MCTTPEKPISAARTPTKLPDPAGRCHSAPSVPRFLSVARVAARRPRALSAVARAPLSAERLYGVASGSDASAAKNAVDSMTRTMALEWGSEGIRVNAIAPGPFPTEGAWARLSPGQSPDEASSDSSGSYSQNPMGRVGEMEELGNLATFLMSDGCNYLNGQTIAIDGAEYLTGGTFYRALASMKDEDWDAIRETIKTTNEEDKAKRSV